jgi:hypothetical protein
MEKYYVNYVSTLKQAAVINLCSTKCSKIEKLPSNAVKLGKPGLMASGRSMNKEHSFPL